MSPSLSPTVKQYGSTLSPRERGVKALERLSLSPVGRFSPAHRAASTGSTAGDAVNASLANLDAVLSVRRQSR